MLDKIIQWSKRTRKTALRLGELSNKIESNPIYALGFLIPYLLSTHFCFGAGLEVKPTPISEEGQRAKTSESEIFLKLQGAIHAHIAMLPMYLTTPITPTESDLWSSGCSFETDSPSKIHDLINIVGKGDVKFKKTKVDFILPKFGVEFDTNSGRKIKILLGPVYAKSAISGIFDGEKIDVKKNIYPELRNFLKTLGINNSTRCGALDEQE